MIKRFILIVLLLSFSVSSFAQNFFKEPPLQLNIESDKRLYDSTDKIAISFNLKNNSDKALRLSEYNISDFKVHLKDVNGDEIELASIAVTTKIMSMELLPGESIIIGQAVLELPFDYSNEEEHSVYAELEDLISNTLRIEIINKNNLI